MENVISELKHDCVTIIIDEADHAWPANDNAEKKETAKAALSQMTKNTKEIKREPAGFGHPHFQ